MDWLQVHSWKHSTLPSLPLWKFERPENNNNLSVRLKLSGVTLILAQTQPALIAILIHRLCSHVFIFSAVGEKLWALILIFPNVYKAC